MKATITVLLAITLALLVVPAALGVLANTIGPEVRPTANTNAITGTYTFTVNYNTTASNGGGTVQNITVYVGTTTACNNVTGNSTTVANASCDYDTAGVTDGTFTITYSLWLTNGTNEVNDTVTGIVIDNTAPTAVLSADFDKVEPLKLFTSDCSRSTDNLGTALNYSQNLTKPSGASSNDTTSTGIATWSETEIDEKGEYTLNCRVMDAGSNIGSQSATIRVASGTPPQMLLHPSVSGKKASSNNFAIIIGITVIILLIGATAIIVALSSKKR